MVRSQSLNMRTILVIEVVNSLTAGRIVELPGSPSHASLQLGHAIRESKRMSAVRLRQTVAEHFLHSMRTEINIGRFDEIFCAHCHDVLFPLPCRLDNRLRLRLLFVRLSDQFPVHEPLTHDLRSGQPEAVVIVHFLPVIVPQLTMDSLRSPSAAA